MTESTAWPSWDGCFALLRCHPRADDVWRFASWWIELEHGRVELLFGWAFPWSVANLALRKWTRPTREKQQSRLLIDAPFSTMSDLLDGLSRGETLAEASQRVGLTPPSKLADARLGTVLRDRKAPRPKPAPDFVSAPWRLIPSRDSFESEISSPISDAPAMRSALVRIDKSRVLPPRDYVAREVLDYLTRETGLSFTPGANLAGRDLARLGDLEVLVFADLPEKQSAVKINPRGDSNTIEVIVSAPLVEPTTPVFVHCRQTHAKATLADALKPLPLSEGSFARSVRFDVSPIGPSGAEIEIWAEDPETAILRLVHAHTYAWIRQIKFSLSLLEGTTTFPADWISDWVGQRKQTKGRINRADAMRRVAHTIHDSTSTVGEPDELWGIGEQSAAQLAARLSPPSSGGTWIPRRTDPDPDPASEGGKVKLFEWFALTFFSPNSRSAGPIIIVDPYFNNLGLDLVYRKGTRERALVVVTAFHDTRDEETKKSKPDPKRVSLPDYHRQLTISFGKRDFSLYTVDAKQLHDRLILEFESGKDQVLQVPRRGFSLSNSLQRATDNHPLLITQIPEDILADVADDIARMIEGLVPFISPPEAAPRATRSAETIKPTQADLDSLLSVLLDSVNDPTVFARTIIDYANSLAHTVGSFAEHAAACKTVLQNDEFLSRLERFLISRVPDPRSPDPARESIGLAQLTAKGVSEFRDADGIWTHSHRFGTGDYPFAFGVNVLFILSPEGFVRVWSQQCAAMDTREENLNDQVARGRRLSALLKVMDYARYGEENKARISAVFQYGFRSAQPFVRVLLAALLGLLLFDERYTGDAAWSWEEGRQLLLGIAHPEERVLAVASWVSNLRIVVNQSNGVESEKIIAKRKQCFEWMIADWSPSFNDVALAEIVKRCEGPGDIGGSGDSTINDLLLPLNLAGKLSAIVIMRLWIGEFERRIADLLKDKHSFYARSDIRLTEVCSWLLARGEAELRCADDELAVVRTHSEGCLVKLSKYYKDSLYIEQRPFARSLNFKSWDSARRTRAWLSAFALTIEMYPDALAHVIAHSQKWLFQFDAVDDEAEDPTRLFVWLTQLWKNRKPSA